jgi:hypothetical protein
MSQLVPGARVAELQHLLNVKEEEARRLSAQQVRGDVPLQAGCCERALEERKLYQKHGHLKMLRIDQGHGELSHG